MRYLGSAFKYIFKNFIFVFVFALIPSYFLAMTADLKNLASIAESVAAGNADVEFYQIFSFLSPINEEGWPFALVFLAVAAVCMPLLLGFIERHMRIGNRSFKGIAGQLNSNFVSTLVVLLVFAVIYELWSLIAAGLIYAVVLILDGPVCLALAVAVLLGMAALISYLASLLLLWLPSMQITGYSFMDSLSYSNQLYVPNRGKLFLAVFLPFLAGVLLQFAIVAVSPTEIFRISAYIFLELIYLVLFLYYNSLMYVAYFDAAGEERVDLKKKFG